MKLRIGTATFDADIQGFPFFPDELRKALDAVTPQVVNEWDCQSQTASPTPLRQVVVGPVNIAFHAATLDTVTELIRLDRGEITRAEYDRRVALDLSVNTRSLSEWMAKLCGFADVGALDGWLQGPFGRKPALSFDFLKVIEDYKARYSLRVETRPDYTYVRLTHPKMPAYRVAMIYLALPRGLEHTLIVRGECLGDRFVPQIDFPAPRFFMTREARPATGTEERRLRKAQVKAEQAAERATLARLAEAKAAAEARLKELREEMEGLKPQGD